MLEACRRRRQVTVVIPPSPPLLLAVTLVIWSSFHEQGMFSVPAELLGSPGLNPPLARQGNRLMSSKTSNAIITGGVGMVFFALCFLPAALHADPDPSLLATGATLFSLGILAIAGGIYLKAHALQSLPRPEPPAPKKRVRGGCELCASQEPAIQCKVHQLQLCPTCLANHYDFRSCVYVPAARRPASKGSKAMAARARAF